MLSQLKNYPPKQLAAQLLCALFHPIFMAVVMSYLIMHGYALPMLVGRGAVGFVMGNVALVTIGVPLVFHLLLRVFGIYSSQRRRAEILSLGIFFLSLICCGAIFANVPIFFVLRKMFYAGTVACVVTLLFELFYPICYQLVALGAVLGIMWVLLYVGCSSLLYFFIGGVVVTGVVATARLYLSEYSAGHTLWAIPVGFLTTAMTFILL